MKLTYLNRGFRRKQRPLAAALAIVASLLLVSAASGISNGQADGSRHPYVGMLAADWGGIKYPVCSGSYAGGQKGDPRTGVFLTAGHCVSWLNAYGATVDQLYVTFDSTATYDPASGYAVTGATTWYQAKAVAFDPGLHEVGDNEDPSQNDNLKDYGVVLLKSRVPNVGRVFLPIRGQLDRMAARGGPLAKVFTNVGYGLDGGPSFGPPSGRMASFSLFSDLWPSLLKLHIDPALLGGRNGGICLWDSGGPQLIPGTDIAVSLTSDADQNCRVESFDQRLDAPDAQAFLGQYIGFFS
jgi:hypothetical protein